MAFFISFLSDKREYACYYGILKGHVSTNFSPVRPREAPPFKVGKKAQLRVNLEQAPAFRPGSREVHFPHKKHEKAS
jgi:hypothetical protein